MDKRKDKTEYYCNVRQSTGNGETTIKSTDKRVCEALEAHGIRNRKEDKPVPKTSAQISTSSSSASSSSTTSKTAPAKSAQRNTTQTLDSITKSETAALNDKLGGKRNKKRENSKQREDQHNEERTERKGNKNNEERTERKGRTDREETAQSTDRTERKGRAQREEYEEQTERKGKKPKKEESEDEETDADDTDAEETEDEETDAEEDDVQVKKTKRPARPKKSFAEKLSDYIIKRGKFALKVGRFYGDVRYKLPQWYIEHQQDLDNLLEATRYSVGHLFWGYEPLLPSGMIFDLKFFKEAYHDHKFFIQLSSDADIGHVFAYGEHTLKNILDAKCIVYQIRLNRLGIGTKKYEKERENLDEIYESFEQFSELSKHLVKGANPCNYANFLLLVGTFKNSHLWKKLNAAYTKDGNYIDIMKAAYEGLFDLEELPSRKIPAPARKRVREVYDEFMGWFNEFKEAK